jgi:hypothetical protein
MGIREARVSRLVALLAAGLMILGGVGAAPAASATPGEKSRGHGPTVFVGEITPEQFASLGTLGIDRGNLAARAGRAGTIRVEAALTWAQAAKLNAQGMALTEKRVKGAAVSDRMAAQAESGFAVFRSFSEPGGIRDELSAVAEQHPDLTKLVRIGESVQGKDILALKVTKDAEGVEDGRRPAVLYTSTQHAREWITTEMTTRLIHHYLDNYATDAEIGQIVDSTELWFVPVANPDGYDFTFTPGNRLWRKNLRDNDGDGETTGLDGVDLNRNFPHRWGYDNEGSSPSVGSEVYRGPDPRSEPETRALDELADDIGFEFHINYHSAAELLLYGVGWQVATPTPDDLLYETLAGDDANPAVPGYDPDISAELYTTNGETTEHMQSEYGTLAFTPEMSTCESASAVDPDDAFEPEDCASVFNFPDSEVLVQAEFEKNLPFALAVARSAPDPDNPVSVVGRTAPDFALDRFDVSYGSPQTVAVTARRDLRELRLNFSINGGPADRAPVSEWDGGERYGDEGDVHYAEFRGQIDAAGPGDSVEVWFTGERPDDESASGRRESEHFTYRLALDTRARVLVIANEDYTGVNPDYPPEVTKPKYAQGYVDALAARDIDSVVWDLDAQGVPHPLGVLDHFDAVVWYLGENRLTQDPEDELIDSFGTQTANIAVAERQQYLTLAVRDFLNEGGRLLHTGETAGYYGAFGATLGGLYYGLDGAPQEECVITTDASSDCLLLADDFTQYYLGGFSRSPVADPTGIAGTSEPLADIEAALGGPGVAANPLNEAGTFTVTSDLLPRDEFPQFRSEASGFFTGAAGGAFDPVEGQWYVGGLHANNSYFRLARTIDLESVAATDNAQLQFALSFDTEPGYDHVIVEAHAVGGDDWTTLPEVAGRSDTELPTDCEAGFLTRQHPFLLRYLTHADSCVPTGSTGQWNRLTGNSGGWQQVGFDLSAYAGQQVEVSISYVTDSSSGGVGVFIDDTRVTIGGAVTMQEGFEAGLGGWAVADAPAGSPGNQLDYRRTEQLLAAAITTPDTVLVGFGMEQAADAVQRSELLGRVVEYLLR